MYFLIPWLVGLLTLVQAGLNRKIAGQWGFPAAVFLNAAVLMVVATLFLMAARTSPHWIPEILRPRIPFSSFSWWFLVPGICGFTLVLGVPIAVSKIGALQTFMSLMVAQLVGSILWDTFVESIPLVWNRIIGTLLVGAGIFLTMR